MWKENSEISHILKVGKDEGQWQVHTVCTSRATHHTWFDALFNALILRVINETEELRKLSMIIQIFMILIYDFHELWRLKDKLPVSLSLKSLRLMTTRPKHTPKDSPLAFCVPGIDRA